MPIYEYACGKCEHEFEAEQRISDDPIKTCPKCRSRKVKKLISKTSFVLKGGGWYSDLYSSSKKDADKGGDKGESTSDSSPAASESKTDTSPAKTEKSEKSDKSSEKSEKKASGKDKKGKSKAA
jgi:putative FmdB family regulatory protein